MNAFLLFGVPLLLIVALVVMLTAMVRQSKGKDVQFDERQKLIRGNGYKWGFLVMIALQFLMLCYLEFGDGGQRIEPALGIVIALFGGILAFGIYCIWNDAFFSLNQKGWLYMGSCALLAILYLVEGLARWKTHVPGTPATFEQAGRLLIGLVFLTLLITQVIHRFVSRNGEDE